MFALISPAPDVLLPVVAAGEIAYLGMLGTHPKFQAYVEAQEAKQTRAAYSVSAQQTLERITSSLPKELLDRFVALQDALPGVAADCRRAETHRAAKKPICRWRTIRSPGWIGCCGFTCGCCTRNTHSIDSSSKPARSRFTRTSSGWKPLVRLPASPASDQQQRVRKALEDNLQTSRDRLTNLQRARDNFDLVKLEIDRLENKIRSLSELAVNRQEPDYISGQVDQVAASMLETEKTMNELQFVTGLDTVDEAPSLLHGEEVVPRKRVKQLN